MQDTILIVDDEREIADLVSLYLENEGFQVFKFYNSFDALKCIENEKIDLAVIDIMLPDIDGFKLCQKIREKYNYPIIMLTAKDEEIDKIMGLTFGADDYVTKPFRPLELVARVKSQLRRYVDLGSMEKKSGVYKTGGLEVDDDEKAVRIDGEYVTVTPTEFGILKLLTENAGKVFSMEQIYENVWNEPAYNPENTVAVHIRRIREKIEINPKNPKYLKVVWGIGYKIEKL